MFTAWGPEQILLYNDGYADILHDKHPLALGRPFLEVWPELVQALTPIVNRAYAGETIHMDDLHLAIHRRGFLEETHFAFSFTPIRDEGGRIQGIFCPCDEITSHVVSTRRNTVLRNLAARLTGASSMDEVLARTESSLSGSPHDLPCTLFYCIASGQGHARLTCSTGLTLEPTAFHAVIDLQEESSGSRFLQEVVQIGRALRIDDFMNRFGLSACGPYPEPPRTAMALPIWAPGREKPAAILVAGASPRMPFDEAYRNFFELVASTISAAFTNAIAFEQEKKRAESLVALDKAKTTFFSNVSHEFRTPLTLIMEPLQDLLSRAEDLDPSLLQQIVLSHRNALRLLKLVNTLLDFSGIEAGRLEASYEPTDLADLTVDLAGVFRSTIEKAGLSLVVDCPPLNEAVYVDRDMWEKIVLNLLSNAFKFTFAGEIGLSLRRADDHAELIVRDTGTGIAAADLPHVFDRFHRVMGARSRTQEGSGIGLAFVQELVKLHHGTIQASSKPGQGTTFRVRIPLGKGHLPARRIGAARSSGLSSLGSRPYIEEALDWLPDESLPGERPIAPPAFRGGRMHAFAANLGESTRILIAEDHADMRRYLLKLLSPLCQVEAVADGLAAWEAATCRTPNLVLADVMMPGLDGFALLKRLRRDAKTREIPVLLLSAHAGEAARIEGMQAGATDYLSKPFSARELVARVEGHLQIARIRRQAEAELRQREQRLRLATDAAQLGVFEYNVQTDLPTWENRRMYEIFGLAPGAPPINLAQLRQEVIHPEDLPRFQKDLSESMKAGTLLQGACRMRRHDGEWRWIGYNAQPDVSPEGQPTRLVGVVNDITERVRAEEALRESEKKFRTVFEQAAIGIGRVRFSDARWIEVNDTFCNMLGYTRDELTTTPWPQITHPEDVELDLTPFRRMAAGELDSYMVEKRFIHKQGHHVWTRLTLSLVRDARGRPDYEIAVIENITDKIAAAAALRKSEEKFKTAFNANPSVMVVSALEDGRYIEVNKAFEEVMGYTREEMIGRTQAEVGFWRDPDQRLRLMERIKTEGDLRNVEVVVRARSGELKTVLLSAERIMVEGVPCSMAAWSDITDRKRAEEEIKRSNQELEQFGYAISHDLQEPLRSIIGFVQLLEAQYGDQIDEKGRHFIARAVAAGHRMQRLIRDLLSLSRVTTGSGKFAATDLDGLVQAVLANLEATLQAKRVAVRCGPLPTLPVDASQIQSLFQNLITNAVKYNQSPNPSVDIGCRANENGFRFFVADNGIGIPPQFHERIFMVFQRLHSEREYPGTGVGLALCKRIVERHGGTIWVESRPGEGSTFYFTLSGKQ